MSYTYLYLGTIRSTAIK